MSSPDEKSHREVNGSTAKLNESSERVEYFCPIRINSNVSFDIVTYPFSSLGSRPWFNWYNSLSVFVLLKSFSYLSHILSDSSRRPVSLLSYIVTVTIVFNLNADLVIGSFVIICPHEAKRNNKETIDEVIIIFLTHIDLTSLYLLCWSYSI